MSIEELSLFAVFISYISHYHRGGENLMRIGSKIEYCYTLQNERHEPIILIAVLFELFLCDYVYVYVCNIFICLYVYRPFNICFQLLNVFDSLLNFSVGRNFVIFSVPCEFNINMSHENASIINTNSINN